MRFSFQIDLHEHRAWSRAVGMLFLVATGCVGHDQLRLKDPSPCHVQCDYNQVAQLDPECHGFHPTCWKPWAADCPVCPPPPSGVYPEMHDVVAPESVPSPQPQLKPPQRPLPTPQPKPAPTETKPGPEIPSTPSEPTPATGEPKPAPGETPPPGETTPAPGDSMPGPDSKPGDTNQSTTPELPPLVPPGREIPQGPQQKEHKPPEKKFQPTSALIEDVLLESAGCRQAKPLGTISEANEPAKLEPAPTASAQQVCGAPPDSGPPQELAAAGESAQPIAQGAAATDTPQTPPADESTEQSGVVQAIYQTIEPAKPEEQSGTAAEESPSPEQAADSDAAAGDEAASSDELASEHNPLWSKLGGILIVGCSLLCGALYLKKLIGGSDDLEIA